MRRQLVLLGCLAVVGLPAGAADAPEPQVLDWPREYSNEAGAKLVIYQPQVTEWPDTERLHARAAIAVSPPKADKPSLGTFEFEADTEVDLENRLVKMSGFEIVKSNFPTLTPEQSEKLLAKLDELLPGDKIIALDRVLANLERAGTAGKGVETNTRPPKIFSSEKPSILVILDGKPIWAPIEGTGLEFAVNTNWDLFHHKESSSFYLRNDDAWIKASSLGGPWSPAGKLPKSFKKLPKDDENWKEARASLPGRKIKDQDVPLVFMSEVPAELILTDGRPALERVEGTKLLWVTNTESDLFLHGKESRFYYLVSGRWFRADDLDGKWSFATHDLPEDFENFPEDHPRASVRASIPGTPEAEEAVLLAQIPQKAKVKRDEVKAEVTYVGEPEFKEIEGTSMYYAANTQNDVIKVGDLYYLCFQAVWFVSASPNGPWVVADEVPDEIYTIPPSSPVYNTTYVKVYDYDDDWVTYGYTSGYWGVYWSYGCAFYGTGWYYPPYYYYGPYYGYPIYYGYPYSYGVGAYYNPYTGTYGRGAVAYGPYGGAGYGTAYNPRTGTYARGGAAYGPYNARGWAEAYNPRTGTYARTRQGANPYASWGTTSIQRGNDWARTARYSDSRGTVAGARTSRGGAAVGYSGQRGTGGAVRTGSGDLYAGRDGNVYRRDSDGWSKYGDGGWSQIDPPGEGRAGTGNRSSAASDVRSRTSSGQQAGQIGRGTYDQLNRDRSGRSQGSYRSGQYGNWRSSGGARPSRGGYGGMSRGGGRGRR